MTFLAATLAGSNIRHVFHRILFAIVMTATIALITDLEYPRRGFIRIDAADEELINIARRFRD